MVSMEDGGISKAQILKASRALKECVSKRNNNELFQSDNIFLQFAVKKVGEDSQKVIKIVLPHGWVNNTTRICLFVKDVDKKSRDYETTIAAYEDLLRECNVDINIDIYPLKKLKLECNDFEAKRHLSNLYDIFLCDSRILRLMPAKLGKHFIGRKKFLIQINLNKADLKEEINKGLRTSQCIMCNKGSSSQVMIGTLKHSDEELAGNIEMVLSKIIACIPGGSQNIRIASLKTEDSLSVPLLVSFESKDEVKIEQKKPKSLKRVGPLLFDPSEAEEISTVADGVVAITPSGRPVIIRKNEVISSQVLTKRMRKSA